MATRVCPIPWLGVIGLLLAIQAVAKPAPESALKPDESAEFAVDSTHTLRLDVRAGTHVRVELRGTSSFQAQLQTPDGLLVPITIPDAPALATIVEFTAEEDAPWWIEARANEPGRLNAQRRDRVATPEDSGRWRALHSFARMQQAIADERAWRARQSAYDALEARARTEPDTLALATFHEDIGIEFLFAPTDTLRAMGEEFLHEALRLRMIIDGERSLLIAESQNTISTYYYLLGRFEDAATYVERSIATLQSLAHLPDGALALARKELAIVYLQLGRYGEAEKLYRSALDDFMRSESSEPYDVADVCNSLGEINRRIGAFDAADEWFVRAAEGAQSLLDAADDVEERDDLERFRATIMLNQAGLLFDEAKYAEAEILYRRVASLWKQKGATNAVDLPAALMSLADICRFQGRWLEAEQLLLEAIQTARRDLGLQHPDAFWSEHLLAELYVEMGRLGEAETLFSACIDRLQDVGEAGGSRLGVPLRGMGNLLAERGEFKEAAGFYARSTGAFSNHGGQEMEAAHSAVREAQMWFELGDTERSWRILHDVKPTLAANPFFPELQVDGAELEADLLIRGGQRRAAIERLEEALDRAQSMRQTVSHNARSRAGFFAAYAEPYRKLATWKIVAGDIEGALHSFERLRSQAMIDQMRIARLDLEAEIPAAQRATLRERRRELQLALADVERRIGSADVPESDLMAERGAIARQMRFVEEDVRRASPTWQRLARSNDTATIAVIQGQLLAGDEAMLLYQVGRAGSFVFLVEPDAKPMVIALEVAREDADLLGVDPGPLTSARLVTMLGARSTGVTPDARAIQGLQIEQPSKLPVSILDWLQSPPRDAGPPPETLLALFRSLVPRQLRERWSELRRLVVVPDGSLHELPFEALCIDEQGTYWIEQGPIVRYAPSATVLWMQKQQRETPKPAGMQPSLLIVCDPKFDPTDSAESVDARVAAQALRGRQLERLPGTAVESIRISAQFDDGATQTLCGANATERQVRAALAEHTYLHFATHGIVESRRDDLFAALALTPGDVAIGGTEDDGYLELTEIYGLELNAELAVLSACATHSGKRIEGEGLFALSRGFLVAGCGRVIGSLWPVADDSTAELMESFFANLTSRDHEADDPARALHEARRALRNSNRWSHPFYWAPFVLVGGR